MTTTGLFKVEILSKRHHNLLQEVANITQLTQFNNAEQNYIEPNKIHDITTWNKLIIPNNKEHPDLYFHLPRLLSSSNMLKVNYNSSNALWNHIIELEKRKDAQLARLFNLSAPNSINIEDTLNAVTDFANELIKDGMIVHATVHYKHKQQHPLLRQELLNLINPEQSHKNNSTPDTKIYLLTTLRSYKNNEFTTKNRDWNHPSKLIEWRERWHNIISRTQELFNNKQETKVLRRKIKP